MKKNIITSLLVLGTGVLMAQNTIDAMRYSQEELNGTARYKAMSGAFGALGGDLSAMAQNPAGSSVFNLGQLGATLGTTKFNNEATFGNTEVSKGYDFSMGQLGTVFVFRNSSSKSDWNKYSIGFNYQKTKVFEGNGLNYSGLNREQSIVDFFGSYAGGFKLSDLETRKGETIETAYRDIGINGGYAMQQAFLGYQGYLLDPKSGNPGETSYSSRANIPTKGVRQVYNLEQYGDVRKYAFNFSMEYGKKIYLGMNLNSHVVNYRNTRHIVENEYNDDPNRIISDVQHVDFSNELYTYGGGFSLQLGTIVKATESLRLGVTYQSPTWYALRDETRQYLDTDAFKAGDKMVTRTIINPNVTNIYEEYNLRTPSQWTASVAYLFGKRGLVSLDYMYKGYTGAQFDTKMDSSFREVNDEINSVFSDTNSFRLGGEFRATPQFSIRAGYRFEQSPYKDKKIIGDLKGYSFGFGYDFGVVSLDASYDISHYDSQYGMFDKGLTNRADVKSNTGNLLLTMLLKL